jgi:hypothetical protein
MEIEETEGKLNHANKIEEKMEKEKEVNDQKIIMRREGENFKKKFLDT